MRTLGKFSLAFAALGLSSATLFAQVPSPNTPVARGFAVDADAPAAPVAPATKASAVSGYAVIQAKKTQEIVEPVPAGVAGVVVEPACDGPAYVVASPMPCGPECCVQEPCVPPVKECAPPCGNCPSFGFWGDAIFLTSRGNDLVFAQPRSSSSPLATPQGGQGILQSDYDIGFRAGGLWNLNDCSAVEVNFLWWENQSHAFVAAVNGGIVQSTITLPNLPNSAGDSLAAAATMGQELRTGDVSYLHVLCNCPNCYCLNWLAGVEYAYLKQNVHGEFTITGATEVDTHVTFEGIGPRIGLDGESFCGCGFRVYGRSTANFLASHIGANFNQSNTFVGNQGSIDYKADRIVPMLDLELGVRWVSPGGRCSVSAGYYVAAFFDVLSSADFINAVQTNNFTTSGGNLKSDITFDGAVLRFEYRF